MHYFFIGDEETAIGFRLAGIGFAVVTNREDCSQTLKKVVKNEDIGIILITEQAANLIRDEVDHYVFSVDFPLICEIPGFNESHQNNASLYELANQAIGLKL